MWCHKGRKHTLPSTSPSFLLSPNIIHFIELLTKLQDGKHDDNWRLELWSPVSVPCRFLMPYIPCGINRMALEQTLVPHLPTSTPTYLFVFFCSSTPAPPRFEFYLVKVYSVISIWPPNPNLQKQIFASCCQVWPIFAYCLTALCHWIRVLFLLPSALSWSCDDLPTWIFTYQLQRLFWSSSQKAGHYGCFSGVNHLRNGHISYEVGPPYIRDKEGVSTLVLTIICPKYSEGAPE